MSGEPKNAEAAAAEKGRDVVYPGERELFVDDAESLQAVLGSDCLHEILSLLAHLFEGNGRPTCFFEKKTR